MKRSLLERALLGEAMLEIPDSEMAVLQRVIASAIKRRVLPLSAKDWLTDKSPKQGRRAADKEPAKEKPHTPLVPWPGHNELGINSKGRKIPATNRFRQANPGYELVHDPKGRSLPPFGQANVDRELNPNFDDDERTDPGEPDHDEPAPKAKRSDRKGRDGDDEEFPEFGNARSASQDVEAPDDRVLSWNFLDKSDDSIDVPEPGGGRQVRTIKKASPKAKGGSIANLFKRRPPDGRKELAKALKDAERETQRKSKPQGMLSRLVKGKDVTK